MYKNKMSIKSENRKRSKNFDNLEREVLLECAIGNRDVIESKFTNQITNIKKIKVWQDTQTKVNALGVASRTVPEVRTKWNNMLQKAKKDHSELIAKKKKTGGGPQPPPLSPISARIVEVYGDSPGFSGLTGVQSSFSGLSFL